MSFQRLLLSGVLFLSVAALSHSQVIKEQKIDPTNLLGVWKVVKTDAKKPPPPGTVVTVDFRRNGKVVSTFTYKGETQTKAGAFTLVGNQLKVTRKGDDGRDYTTTAVVVTLTDKTLVTKERRGAVVETIEFRK